MNVEILKRILETVIAYYKANNDILPNDDTEDLKRQIEYLEEIIKWDKKDIWSHLKADRLP